MVYTELTDVNTTEGLHKLLVYVSDVVPIFVPMMLFSFFLIFTLGIYFSQMRLRGRGNFFVAVAVGSYITTLLAFAMSLIEGLISREIILIVLTITGIVTMLLLVFRDK